MPENVAPLSHRNAATKIEWLSGWKGVALLTCVTVISARISFHIPQTPVPVTLQVMAALLSGLVLGAKRGAASQIQYLALGMAGAPVFADGKAGALVLFGATGGYLLALPLAALVTGWLCNATKNADPSATLLRQMLGSLAGVGVIYACGFVWFRVATGGAFTPMQALMASMGWFLAWDMAKSAGAVALARALRR